jgi:hypothetical protein
MKILDWIQKEGGFSTKFKKLSRVFGEKRRRKKSYTGVQ